MKAQNMKHPYILINARNLYSQQDNFNPKHIHQTHWSELADELREPLYQLTNQNSWLAPEMLVYVHAVCTLLAYLTSMFRPLIVAVVECSIFSGTVLKYLKSFLFMLLYTPTTPLHVIKYCIFTLRCLHTKHLKRCMYMYIRVQLKWSLDYIS